MQPPSLVSSQGSVALPSMIEPVRPPSPEVVVRINIDDYDGSPHRLVGAAVLSRPVPPTSSSISDISCIQADENEDTIEEVQPAKATIPSLLDDGTTVGFGACMLERLAHLKRTTLYEEVLSQHMPTHRSTHHNALLLEETLAAIHHHPDDIHTLTADEKKRRARLLDNPTPLPSRASALARFKAEQRDKRKLERGSKGAAMSPSAAGNVKSNIITLRSGGEKPRRPPLPDHGSPSKKLGLSDDDDDDAIIPRSKATIPKRTTTLLKAPSSGSAAALSMKSKTSTTTKTKRSGSDSLSSSDDDDFKLKRSVPRKSNAPQPAPRTHHQQPPPTTQDVVVPPQPVKQRPPTKVETSVTTTKKTQRVYHTIPLL